MSGVFDFISMFFSNIWRLFMIEYPGVNIPIGFILIGALVAVLGLSILGHILGFSFSPVSIVRSFYKHEQRKGGNNKNIKISSERKGDTY